MDRNATQTPSQAQTQQNPGQFDFAAKKSKVLESIFFLKKNSPRYLSLETAKIRNIGFDRGQPIRLPFRSRQINKTESL